MPAPQRAFMKLSRVAIVAILVLPLCGMMYGAVRVTMQLAAILRPPPPPPNSPTINESAKKQRRVVQDDVPLPPRVPYVPRIPRAKPDGVNNPPMPSPPAAIAKAQKEK